jgi:hypothetical protein
MTDQNIVEPEDIETPAPVEPEENDDELEPEVDPAPPANETPEQKDARLAALSERNDKLWARLQREKARNKPASPQAPAAPAPTAAPALSRDEAVLIAKGFSEDEIVHAQKVATLQGVVLTEAVKDDLFTAWKTKKDTDAKDAQAQLGTSRGAPARRKKSFDTPGLAAEDHKALFQERMGKR